MQISKDADAHNPSEMAFQTPSEISSIGGGGGGGTLNGMALLYQSWFNRAFVVEVDEILNTSRCAGLVWKCKFHQNTTLFSPSQQWFLVSPS
jgi:hypothetical protein